MASQPHFIFFFTTTILLLITMVSSIEFIFNNFTTLNQNQLLLYGTSQIESSTLTLTNTTNFTIGRALYFSKIHTKQNSSQIIPFSSSFIFSMAPYKNLNPGHGFAFLFTPSVGINGTTSSQHLGLFNLTNDGKSDNHVFAIEFDVFQNEELNDVNDNHVGVNVNSLRSVYSNEAGFWGGRNKEQFKKLKLNNGVNYQVWIDYKDMEINITMANAGFRKPNRPLINAIVNLSDVLLDEMYVGFTASTGQLVQYHRILSWGFSNSNSSIGDALLTTNLPSFIADKGSIYRSKSFILWISFALVFVLGCVIVVFLILLKRNCFLKKGKERIEDWEVEYWPHRLNYQEIEVATKKFSEENVIGIGGNGKVYKGTLLGGKEVAVKKISFDSERGIREFLTEVSTLGRLKQRNLVGLIGWCKKEKGCLILVYEYMENGSLDKRIFECGQSLLLNWDQRINILKDVANAILYLHEGWDFRVLHRDIKASNVLLDKEMNAKLGDFGLARMHLHEELVGTTQVVGTVGYMAPEVVQTGRVTAQTDIFGFGVLILEVVCGRRPTEEGKPGLVDWVWSLMEEGELVNALDERLRINEEFNVKQVENTLNLGLLCVYPDPQKRPTIRQVISALDDKNEVSESRNEGMEANLLDKNRTRAMWSKYYKSFGARKHPTFEDMQNAASSVTLSGSFIIVEGR